MQNHWLQKSIGLFDGVLNRSFNTLGCPQVHVRNVNKKRAHHRTRTYPSLVVQVSSTVLQTEEGGELPKSNQIQGSFTSQERFRIPVGIIGGVSVVSTLIFLEKYVWWSSRGGGDSAPFIVCSDPAISILRQSTSTCGKDKNDHYSIIEDLRQKRVFLEQSGARCIVMPCHVSHLWHSEVSLGCSVPFLNIGDCVARELKEAKFRPLEAGGHVQIGVLADNSISMAVFYTKKLQSQGFEVVLPDKPTMEHAVLPALEALKKKDMEGAQNLLRIAIHLLLMRAVNTIVLASDELRNVLPPDDPLLKRCVDPMDALGFEVVLPDKPTLEHAVLPALEALKKKDMEGAQNLLRIAIHLLLMRAVNTIVLASDELMNVLPPDDPLLKRCVDPMDALVRATISLGRTSQKPAYYK